MSESVNETPTVVQPGTKGRVIGFVILALVILLTIGITPRIFRAREARHASSESLVTHPTVAVITASLAPSSSELDLPGNIEPMYTAALFARTDGYLERRLVDIGSKLKRGQLIAAISSPEVDQQLAQAKAMVGQAEAKVKQTEAALLQAEANAELARLIKERDTPLGAEHALSQQVVDTAVQTFNARSADVAVAEANIGEAKANLTAAQANVSRLQEMQSFEYVRAPFDGVIIERNVERGDLVALGPSAKPLFRIAQSDTMRTTVDVPQSEAINIKDGDTAAVTFKEHIGRTYSGRIVRNTNALEMAARTMRVEVELNNRDGSLLPGMYANVKFTLPRNGTLFIVPSSAVIIDQKGARVAVVQQERVHFQTVVLGQDMGEEVEVLDGVGPKDALINNPSDLISEGQEVKVQ